MIRNKYRVVNASAIGFALVLALTACDSAMVRGPLSVSRNGDHLMVGICQDIKADSVLGQERNVLGQWGDFWNGSGQIDLKAGEVLTTESLGAELEYAEVIRDPVTFPARGLLFIIKADGSPGPTISAAFDLGFSQLREGSWLQPDGQFTAEPCG